MEFPRVLQVALLERVRVSSRALRERACWCSTRRLAEVVLWASVVLCACASAESRRPALITSLKVDVHQEKIEVRIEADRELSVQTMVLGNPDRIVLDAAGAAFKLKVPEIQSSAGPVKSIRVGLLRAQPPVTRIVVETSAPVPYVFRTERNLAFLDIPLKNAPQTPLISAETPAAPPRITYNQGLLTISAENSTLAEILDAIHARIGGTTEFPASAANERAAVHLGPAPLVRVIAALLLGSPFDYVIVGSGPEPGGIQILLSEKKVLPENALAENRTNPSEAIAATTSPANAPLVNYAGGTPVAVSDQGNVTQPSDGVQLMVNMPQAGMAGAEPSQPIQDFSMDAQAPDSPPQRPQRSKEGPRIPPPGKGH
jgi:AMIN domain